MPCTMKLKPCPFCGAEPELISEESLIPGHKLFHVECVNDGCQMDDVSTACSSSPFGAVDAWNCRAERTCHAVLTETLSGVSARVWECSECGHTFEDVNGEYAFCPRCGARVVGVGE